MIKGGCVMVRKGILLMVVLLMMLMCVSCGSGDGKGDIQSTQYIIVVKEAMSMEEISQTIAKTLPSNQQVTVEDVEFSEENKYLVTISSRLTEDDIVSLLKEEDWVQRIQINYELTMY